MTNILTASGVAGADTAAASSASASSPALLESGGQECWGSSPDRDTFTLLGGKRDESRDKP